MTEYFADTYALIEFVRGNRHYSKYFLENKTSTTRLNLMELYYATLREGGEELAEEYYESFLSSAINIDDETIKDAMKFRYSVKKKKLSYVDAIGYMLALEKGIKFLTGDNQFKGMADVEFVK